MQPNVNTTVDGSQEFPRLSNRPDAWSDEADGFGEHAVFGNESADLAAEKVQQGLDCTLKADFPRPSLCFPLCGSIRTHPRIHFLRGDAYRLLSSTIRHLPTSMRQFASTRLSPGTT